MPQVTPLGVKLGSQVCEGIPHAWFQRIMLPKMEHAVGVWIVPQTCMACLPFHMLGGVFHT